MARAFKINNISVKKPTKDGLSVNVERVVDKYSGRNEYTAEMDIHTIGLKRTISIEWIAASDSESSVILNAIGDNDFVTIDYPDPKAGTNITKTFYNSSSQSQFVTEINDVCYWNITLNVIEK